MSEEDCHALFWYMIMAMGIILIILIYFFSD